MLFILVNAKEYWKLKEKQNPQLEHLKQSHKNNLKSMNKVIGDQIDFEMTITQYNGRTSDLNTNSSICKARYVI